MEQFQSVHIEPLITLGLLLLAVFAVGNLGVQILRLMSRLNQGVVQLAIGIVALAFLVWALSDQMHVTQLQTFIAALAALLWNFYRILEFLWHRIFK